MNNISVSLFENKTKLFDGILINSEQSISLSPVYVDLKILVKNSPEIMMDKKINCVFEKCTFQDMILVIIDPVPDGWICTFRSNFLEDFCKIVRLYAESVGEDYDELLTVAAKVIHQSQHNRLALLTKDDIKKLIDDDLNVDMGDLK